MLEKKLEIFEKYKVTFLATFFWGLLAHFYMLTNKLPNYDEIRSSPEGYGSSISSGRWMLYILGEKIVKPIFGGSFSLPWFTGIITIFILALTACLVIKALGIESRINCILLAGCTITFPAITCLFFFMFTAVYYAFAIFLSVLSVVLLEKKETVFFLLSCSCLICSLGIYQAYFPLAIALFVLSTVRKCILSQFNESDVLNYIVKTGCAILLSLAGYLFVNRMMLLATGFLMDSYQGLNEIGSMDIITIVYGVKKSYEIMWAIAIENYLGMYPTFLWNIVNIIVLTSILFILWNLVRESKDSICKKLILIVGILLFPVSINMIYIMAPNSNIYSLMCFPLVCIYFLIILLQEVYFTQVSFYNKIIATTIAIFIFINAWYANGNYVALEFAEKQAESYFTTMITEIKSVDGYDDSLPIIMIGNTITDNSFYENTISNTFKLGGKSGSLLNIYSRDWYLKYYLGFNAEFYEDENWQNNISIVSMPTYPADGSIEIIDGKIIIKLED